MFHKDITFGIEYTYLHKYEPGQLQLAEAYSLIIERDFLRKNQKVRVRQDHGVVEINSPPFSNLKEAEVFFNQMEDIVKRYPFVTKVPGVMGGGGHIHVRPPLDLNKVKQKTKLYAKLARYFTLHPYIAWMFNEWADHKTAKNFNHILWDTKTFHLGRFFALSGESGRIKFDPEGPNRYDMIRKEIFPDSFNMCTGSKEAVLRVDTPEYSFCRKPTTFEFRSFDAKETFKDVKDHVVFLNALIAYVDGLKNVPVSPYNTPAKFLNLGKGSAAIDGFRGVIKELNLSQRVYERFYENFEMRKKRGKLV